MLSYLQELSLRLGLGAGQLSDEQRQRHGSWLLASQRPDGGFAGREGGSDLYYTSFALRSLAMLDLLSGKPAEQAAAFLAGRLTSQAPIVDFLSLVYSAMLLDAAAGLDIFAQAKPGWREAVAAALETLRRDDGGYAKSPEGQASSTYQTFLVALGLQVIEQPLVEPDRLRAFVLSRRREDGGFVEIAPMRNSGANPTAAAVGLLKILGHWETPPPAVAELRRSVIDYLADMQSDEGGFLANSRIVVPDVLSTFTATLSLIDLDGLDAIDLARVGRFLRSLECEAGGFLAGEWDQVADIEYTFYGLGGLALLAALQKGLLE